ncbi:hypothetical protein TNIN_138701 [Trichonephila inaurata madagascariensis]|uniref:Uncharacterized protein n=1 Tax=Trichonephila inaurata madagascariensis TaxID=2747483 RepID=A0A8X6JZ49_9ARAC|nr:hypothetical protein TNIN_138701 [Trichonephila inaurata madagascariensis]
MAICAGALAVAISVVALPVYGGIRLFRTCEKGPTPAPVRRRAPPNHHVRNIGLHCGKIIAVAGLGALALCAGTLVAGISLIALPLYGGIRLFRSCENHPYDVTRSPSPTVYHIPNVGLKRSQTFP